VFNHSNHYFHVNSNNGNGNSNNGNSNSNNVDVSNKVNGNNGK
jgi:hypothetical protein